MMIPAAIANIVNPGILRLLSVMDGVPAVAVDERAEDWVLVSLRGKECVIAVQACLEIRVQLLIFRRNLRAGLSLSKNGGTVGK
jgi:hypothetical protein